MDESALTSWIIGMSLKISEQLKNARNSTSRRLVTEAQNIVRERYMESEITLDDVCSALGVSNSYFSSIFKKEMGKSFISYLTDYRMDIAAENIANMDTTRTESGGPYRRKNVLLESYSDTSFAQAMENAARGKGITSRHAGVRVSGIVEDDREAKKVYNPDHPDADADGYVTMPNVDVLKETVDSMSATRSYEANVTALNAIKLMAQKALEIGK